MMALSSAGGTVADAAQMSICGVCAVVCRSSTLNTRTDDSRSSRAVMSCGGVSPLTDSMIATL